MITIHPGGYAAMTGEDAIHFAREHGQYEYLKQELAEARVAHAHEPYKLLIFIAHHGDTAIGLAGMPGLPSEEAEFWIAMVHPEARAMLTKVVTSFFNSFRKARPPSLHGNN